MSVDPAVAWWVVGVRSPDHPSQTTEALTDAKKGEKQSEFQISQNISGQFG